MMALRYVDGVHKVIFENNIFSHNAVNVAILPCQVKV